jgi:hypothetical protein
LVFEHDLSSRRVEKNLSTRTSDHGEAERLFLIFKLKLGAISTAISSTARWALENSVRDLVDFVGRILDLNVQALIFAVRQYLWSSNAVRRQYDLLL